ncbi:MAG TPA: anhydro-N-acetylmuramic acid kinase [Candidatus Sphingobacterium stercoripullorum]|uniref:Anhydro-N-acetylmuramic acid kinase n=1 Tax=Candidatus Sphingobacterium stercoripullorum TaxID=2838759 RepID=A0A9D2AYD4_9SPHI|nr:anhydro-N-acetylmuramic acid kinase [Candidatus Sphingobacterium stercoripullorum]
MQNPISSLYDISLKEKRMILGLMSGTSLDGLDLALCEVTGYGFHSKLKLLKFHSQPYDPVYSQMIKEVFAKRTIDLQRLTGLNAWVANYHAGIINDTLRSWGISRGSIDLIASHGQTVYHAPQRLTQDYDMPNASLQIGDGDHIAQKTGIITISDFRQKHLAAKGEGAPLVTYGDCLLFRDDKRDRVLLNIGGISNFTYLPRINSSSDEVVFGSDLGPGNTLLNQYMQKVYGLPMDEGAQLASQGKVLEDLLSELLRVPFLQEPFPKTTGPELFSISLLDSYLKKVKSVNHHDVLATLSAFTAQSIRNGLEEVIADPDHCDLYVSGGGVHNPLIMTLLSERWCVSVRPIDDLGISADAKEACLFAVLANELFAPQVTKYQILDSPSVRMGKISLPY